MRKPAISHVARHPPPLATTDREGEWTDQPEVRSREKENSNTWGRPRATATHQSHDKWHVQTGLDHMNVRKFVSQGAGPTHRYQDIIDAPGKPSIRKPGGEQQERECWKPVGERKREGGGARNPSAAYVRTFFCNVDVMHVHSRVTT